MADFKNWLESDTSRELTEGVTFIDADTVATEDHGLVRLQGVGAPETAKTKDGQIIGKIEAGGFESSEQVAKLARDMGFTEVRITGEAAYGRKAGDLYNPETGESFRTRLAQEGILGVNPRYDTSGLSEAADYGALLRTRKDADNDWDKARKVIEEAAAADNQAQGFFRRAQGRAGDWKTTVDYLMDQGMSEEEAKAEANKRYNPDVAAIEYGGRDTATGDSLNPFSDAWDTGLIGVQESMWGVVNMLGETVDSEWLEQHGASGVQRAQNRIGDRGRIITDYKDVDGFWDGVQYITNNAAMSLPYMGISAGAALLAPATLGLSLTAPASVYAGQTWNEMEGDKNAAVAVGAGIAQAALDRLGIGLVLKGAGKAPKDMLQAGINKLVADGMTKEAATQTVMAATRKELAGFAGDAAKVAAQQLQSKAVFKNMAGRVATGALGEGATEALQESVGYLGASLGSDKVFDWNELAERQMQAIVAGSALGGAFSVPATAYDVGAWADVAYRQAPAEAKRLSKAGQYAEEEKADFGRVASIQELTHQTAARAKAAGPNAHATIEERAENDKRRRRDRTAGEKLADTFMSMPALWRGATRWIFDEATLDKSRAARIAADMFGGQLQRTFSGSSYENQKHHIATIYQNLVPDPSSYWKSNGIRGKKAAAAASAQMYQAFNAAIDPKTKEIDMDLIPANMRPLVQQMQALGDKMWQDQKKFNEDLGYQQNYLLRYKAFDKQNIHKNKREFANLLKKNFGFTDAEAMELTNKITDSAEVNDFNDILEGTGAAGKPGSHKERTLDLSEHADFQQFMEQDIFNNIANAAKAAARFQAYSEFVGDNHSVLNQLLADMEADGVAPEKVDRIAAQMNDYLAAESGNYKRAQTEAGKRLERVQRNLMKWMALAGLPLATVSSFVELALTAKALTPAEMKGLKVDGEKIAKDLWESFGEAAAHDAEAEGDLTPTIKEQNILARLGYSTWEVGSANTTSTANKVGATEVSAVDDKFMDTFFKAIGLTQWTNFTRKVRASMAGDWLKAKIELIATSDPDSKTNEVQEAEEQMRNYGLDVDTTVQRFLEGQPLDDAQLREFVFNWVNDAVVLPQAANRPLIYQDPRFALFTQFQGFISAFTATQIPKLWGEYVKRGTPSMKYNAFAVMTTMIMLGFVSQHLKDLLKYGQTSPWLERPEYLQRGVRASGLLGTGERVLDQFFPIYETRSKNAGEWIFNTTTGESPSLGFAKRMLGGVGSLTQGDVGRAAETAVQSAPFLGPFTFLRKEAGEIASNWNFKGE